MKEIFSYNTRELLVKVYKISDSHASSIISGNRNTSTFIENGMGYFEKIKIILNNLQRCGAKEHIQKFYDICEDIETDNLKDLVNVVAKKGYAPTKYASVSALKRKVGNMLSTTPITSEDRFLVSAKLFFCYMALQNLVILDLFSSNGEI